MFYGIDLSRSVTTSVREFDFINPQNKIETALKNLTEQDRLHRGRSLLPERFPPAPRSWKPCKRGRFEELPAEYLRGFVGEIQDRVREQTDPEHACDANPDGKLGRSR